MREAGRIVSVAVTIAVGLNADGRCEVLGMAVGSSEAETFLLGFLRSLKRRGLAGVKLVISDAHEGLKAANTRCYAPPPSAAASTLPATRWDWTFGMRWRRAALCLKGIPEIVTAWTQPGYSPRLHAPTP